MSVILGSIIKQYFYILRQAVGYFKQTISGNRKEIKLNEPYRIVSCERDLNVQANVKEAEKRIIDKY